MPIDVTILAHNLEVPWAIALAPDGRMFVTERPGRIRIFDKGHLLPDPWMTLNVAAVGEGGLLGIALDPDFPKNRWVYVAHTYRGQDGRLWNRLVRLRESEEGKGVFDRVLVDGARGNANHNGGRVKFGPDGKIYWTMGEAWMRDLAQDLKSLNGKVLRVNPDGSVPDDNPFPGSYIYTYGNRNAQGLDWQPGTGRLYATEHGPSGEWKGYAQDKVNLLTPGANYGWPIVAGSERHDGMVPPVIESGLEETWAPSGAAFVSSGPWAGSFVFAGLRGRTLYRLILDPNNPEKAVKLERHLAGKYGRLREVVEGPDQELYVTTSNRDGRGDPAPEDDRILKIVIS